MFFLPPVFLRAGNDSQGTCHRDGCAKSLRRKTNPRSPGGSVQGLVRECGTVSEITDETSMTAVTSRGREGRKFLVKRGARDAEQLRREDLLALGRSERGFDRVALGIGHH